MSDDKLQKLEEEEKKAQERLNAVKKEKQRIKRELAKKQKAERDAWLVVLGEVAVKQVDLFPGGPEGLLSKAEETLNSKAFQKLKDGLSKEGIPPEGTHTTI